MKGSIFRRMGWGGAATDEDGPSGWDADVPSNRRYRRWATDFEAFIDVKGQSYACRVLDISPGGVRIRLLEAAGMAPGTELKFDLEGWGQLPAVVRHGAHDVLGLEFMLLEGEEVELARWLVRHRPERRQTRHACNIQANLRWAGQELACQVVDISRTGARIETVEAGKLEGASEVTLALPGREPILATVRYVEDASLGLNFHTVFEGELPA